MGRFRLTGKKIIVDTYDGFEDTVVELSRKDPTKVDRSGTIWRDILLKILLPVEFRKLEIDLCYWGG